jgi:mannose-6-phosphate isomerase-like protein (cupin superfamily)
LKSQYRGTPEEYGASFAKTHAMEKTTQKRVTRANRKGWDGVEVEGYRPGAATGVERHTIVGGRKESASDPGPGIEVRYFELAPGAVSRLEKHEHEHFVIVKCGLGHAVIEQDVTEIAANDVIYVAPLELHQFVNRGEEPFGFYCIVNAVRDFSQEPSAEDLARLNASPAGKIAKPFAVPPPARKD